MDFIESKSPARIRVIGVGGCGGNIVHYLQQRRVDGIDYAAVNTDAQALQRIDAECVHIGGEATRGLGTGAKPELAVRAAEDDRERLVNLVRGYDMVFVVAGMGKGTGTGASPIVARLACEQNALTVAVATMPFRYERRDHVAQKGIAELGMSANSLLIAPNSKLQEVLGDEAGVEDALAAANEVLYNAIYGISEIITKPGELNLDFNDVRTVMTAKGRAVMGSATKSGTDRAAEATHEALCCPIMEDVELSGANYFLVNVTAPRGCKLSEIDSVYDILDEKAPACGNERFCGLVYDDTMGDKMRVTVIATGIGGEMQNVKVEEAKPNLAAVAGGSLDPCFVTGRGRQKLEDMRVKYGGDERKVPTIMRRQKN